MKKGNLTEGSCGRVLITFALPMILGNLFQQIYNIADSMIVGRYLGESALAAVGASYAYTNVIIMMAIGGGIGASVISGQLLGAGRNREMVTSVHTAILFFLAFSLLLAGGSLLLNRSILIALRTPSDILADAVLYLNAYSIGIPFCFMYNILSAEYNALGLSNIPLGLLIFSSLLNIVLDIFAIRVLEMGVVGAAIATVIAQGISAVLSMIILEKQLKKYREENSKAPALFSFPLMISEIRSAIPATVQQSIVSIGMLLMQSSVNLFGASALAGYSAGARMESFMCIPMIATGNAISAFTAQNLGAGKIDRIKKGYRTGMWMIVGFGIILILFANLLTAPVISLFIDPVISPEAFRVGTAHFLFTGSLISILGFKAVTDAVLRGAGDTTIYMIANLVNLAIRVTIAKLLSPIWGIQFIWYSSPIGWAANFAISYYVYRKGHWKSLKTIQTA